MTSTRTKVVLLTGQTFSLGLLLALVLIAANAIFLAEYGSAGLPYTYIGMAVIGVPTSMLLAGALRRWQLPLVSSVTIAAYTLVFFGSWLALRAGAVWVSGLLLMLFVVVIQVGFVLVGGQAGRLFDVREIKALFPRVISGFAAGFLIGGVVAPLLLSMLGHTEDLLLGATVGGVAFLVLVVETGRRFPVHLAMVDVDDDTPRVPVRALLAKRFIVLIFVYQVFSAIGSQFLDFIVFDRAAARYEGSEDLARVVSVYTAAMNTVNIVFLGVIAGMLMRRFGLRLGLTANPISVAVLLVAILAATGTTGSTSLLVFVLVAGARIADITVTDGMTRTSINAAYQVLPDQDRLAVQAMVEGVGVPIAIGLSGVLLIVVDVVGAGFVTVTVATLALCIGWTISAVMVHRGYAAQLVTVLRRRAVDPHGLTIDDATLVVLDELLGSDDILDVRLALDALEATRHDRLDERLRRLADDPRATHRAAALQRSMPLGGPLALASARRLISDPDPAVRCAALHVIGAHGDDDELEAAAASVGTSDRTVEVAALIELRQRYGTTMSQRATQRLTALSRSSEPDDRIAAARVLTSSENRCRAQPGNGPSSESALEEAMVATLINDSSIDVAIAAITAAGALGRPSLVPLVIQRLDDHRTASAAAAAVIHMGAPVADVLHARLSEHPGALEPAPSLIRLVRACAQHPGAVHVLRHHLTHPQRDLRLAVLTSLGSPYNSSDGPALDTAMMDAAGHAARCLDALDVLAELNHPELQRALRDEIQLARVTVIAVLVMRYDSAAVHGAARKLDATTGGETAIAYEMLDENVTRGDRIGLVLLQPGLSDAERQAILRRKCNVGHFTDSLDALTDLADDPSGTWARPWLRVCALHAIGTHRLASLTATVAAATTANDTDVAATAAWSAERLKQA